MSILLLGANGQVGFELRSTLAPLGDVVALARPEIDFAAPESLRKVVRDYRPTAIVNAAAYTAVDKAETDVERATAVNAIAPGVLAAEAAAIGAILVHFSTDYVFDGSKASPYVETDATAPLSVYGRSKRDGELAIQQRCDKHLILRTSWVFGAHGQNFIKSILRLAKDRRNLRVVADQFGAPTSASLLAQVTSEILSEMQSQPAADPRWGLYHLAAGGEINWHGLACHVIARAQEMGYLLEASSDTIEPIATAEYPAPAKRPINSRLATARLRECFAVALPDWTAGVDAFLDQLIPEIRQ
jgi:dTDP-4-dehydrorhamnose reductase